MKLNFLKIDQDFKVENCNADNIYNILKELYKRIVIPLYIPVLILISLLLIFRSKEKDAPGEVTHKQALWTACAATVGLGNIAGVAIAVSLGGPGATFWMIVAGLLGMSLKFCECTLGVKYRVINEDGSVSIPNILKKYMNNLDKI